MQYRVVDLRTEVANEFDILIDGVSSPEEACRQALGIQVMRSGHRKNLVARVYFQVMGQPVTMVRLYSSPLAPS